MARELREIVIAIHRPGRSWTPEQPSCHARGERKSMVAVALVCTCPVHP
jgi:hypothetical protein